MYCMQLQQIVDISSISMAGNTRRQLVNLRGVDSDELSEGSQLVVC